MYIVHGWGPDRQNGSRFWITDIVNDLLKLEVSDCDAFMKVYALYGEWDGERTCIVKCVCLLFAVNGHNVKFCSCFLSSAKYQHYHGGLVGGSRYLTDTPYIVTRLLP